jgi:phenylalanine ammonia-lyase
MSTTVKIGSGEKITLNELVAVTRGSASVALSRSTASAMNDSKNTLEKFVDNRTPIYGLNTQFGDQVKLFDVNLKNGSEAYYASLKNRQRNLVRSHNIGTGYPAKEDYIRGALLLRAHCLAQGYSGVRLEIVETLLTFLERGITPVIKRFGSIGASGDLIPLASVAAAMIGESTPVFYKGGIENADEVLKSENITPIVLEIREGLALINGTSFMTSIAAHALYDLKRIYRQMLKALALSLESLSVIDSGYKPIVHELKHHAGEIEVNAFFNDFWKGSSLVRELDSFRKKMGDMLNADGETNGHIDHLQDYYSVRSIPQGFGAMHENLSTAERWITEEMNSINDNPIVSAKNKEIYQGANFMGYYVTSACDMLKGDIAQAATWLHAILANMVHERKNFGLPANLTRHPEIDNGFRPIQILAASVAVQARKLAQHQASFMLPTEGDNQDVNSLASHAAFDFSEAVSHLETLTAIMLLAGAQAIELRGIDKAGIAAKATHKAIRVSVPFIEEDRPFSDDIEKIKQLMKEEKI